MTTTTEALLLVEIAGGVATLTLNRPGQFNALSSALIGELQAALPGWELAPIESDAWPDETGATYEDNALLKARFGRSLAEPDEWVLGEDSGIECDALGGEPGLHSARWSTNGDQADALLERLGDEPNRGARMVAWLVAVALFMENLDATIVNTAVPTMSASLGVAPLSLKGVLTSYTLSLAVFIPISGWAADRYGTCRIFKLAVWLFGIGSLACGLAPNVPVLVAARILQGMGGAMMTPVGRLALSRILNVLFGRLLRIEIRDMSSGFRVYDRRVIQSLHPLGEHFDVMPEIVALALAGGHRVVEVPFHYHPRDAGVSKARVLAFSPSYIRTLTRCLARRWKRQEACSRYPEPETDG